MLPQEAVANLIQGSQYPRVVSLFPLILSRTSQLQNDQRAGVLFACVLFGGLHWPKAVAMLEALDEVTQNEVLQLFKAFIQRTNGEGVANWLFANWKHVEPYHFELIKHLKSQAQSQVLEVLLLSLCVQVVEVPIFVEYTAYFAKTPASKVLVGYLKNYKRQPILTFNEFTALCSALMLEANIPVIKKCNEELMNSLLSDWIALLEKTAATVHLSDKGSIQEAIDEFIRAYGPIDEPFSKDLFTLGSSLGLLLHETPKIANYKQLGISQYSIGGSQKVQRQLWCVPSGDGKSMILNFSALLGLKTGMFQKVHLVYANKHLMTRDKVDFEDLWHLAKFQDRIEHHIGCDFEAEENSLVLIDESDVFMFNKPKNFAKFIKAKFCICFTATPSNCDQQGVENEVVKVLDFKQYDYIITQAPIDVAARLQCDEVVQAHTLEEKVFAIESLLKQGSVLVYATEGLVERLKTLVGAIIVDENTDPLLLRQLDKAPYRLLIATDSFAMRGIDYRSKLNPMFLVIAQQFSCTRDALQGLARVGRFGDPCRRIKFSDCVQLVDQRKQREHNAQLLSFIEECKGKVQVQAASASKFSPKKPQPTQGARMSQARARGLLAQPSASKVPVKLSTGQLLLAKFFKPNLQ